MLSVRSSRNGFCAPARCDRLLFWKTSSALDLYFCAFKHCVKSVEAFSQRSGEERKNVADASFLSAFVWVNSVLWVVRRCPVESALQPSEAASPAICIWSGSPRWWWNERRTTWVTSACPLPRTPPTHQNTEYGLVSTEHSFTVSQMQWQQQYGNRVHLYALFHVFCSISFWDCPNCIILCIYTSWCIYSSQLHILTQHVQSDCVKLGEKKKTKKKKPLLDVDFGHQLQRRGQTAVQLRAAGHSPVCFLSTVEFIWARSYKHMNGPQCVHSVLTSHHQCGWDTPCPGKYFRKTLCRLRRMKQSWFEAMLDLPSRATGLRTITKPSPCWSSTNQFRSYSLCTRKNYDLYWN